MKIAIVTDRIYPFFMGGYEYYLYKIAGKLSSDFDVKVFTSLTTKGPKQIDGIHFHRFFYFQKYTNNQGEHSIGGILKYLISVIFNNRSLKDFDLVIMNSIPYFGLPFLINKVKHKSKVVVVFYEAWYNYPYGGLLNYVKRKALRREIRKIVRQSDSLFSISKPTTESLIVNYCSKNVITAPLGLDLKQIGESTASSEKFDLVYLGRLASIKRIEDILMAVDILKRRGRDLKVAIIGDGPMRERLQSLVEERNLHQNVRLLGNISDQEKYSVLKSSRIFVMPSEREGFSIATLEGMACGCVPIVAIPKYQELFGISHFLINEENGVYFPVSNIEVLASKILKLLSDEAYYSKLQSNALRDSLKYTWENSLGAIEDYIKRTRYKSSK